MSAVHELAEKIEHVAHSEHSELGGHGGHGSHGGKVSGAHIGITMAVLGVMLALCSALVGAQRTLLIETMVTQSTKWGLAQAEATKFRVIEADLELLRSITPKKDEVKKIEATLRSKRTSSGRADDEDTAELKDLIASSTEDMADLLTPDPAEVTRFKKLARTYELDHKEAKEDAEAYDGAIEAHQEAAEHYEWGQLAAEVGIVVASIALLLSSRMLWIVSLCLGLGCAGTLSVTMMQTGKAVEAAEKKIRAASENVQKLEADDDDAEDEAETGGAAEATGEGKAEAPKAEAAKPEAPKDEHAKGE